MSIIELAQLILKDKKEMHFKDIAQQAMILDNSLGADLDMVAKKVAQTLGAHITRHEKKSTAIFKRVPNGKNGFKAGIYALIKRKPIVIDGIVNYVEFFVFIYLKYKNKKFKTYRKLTMPY